MNETFRRPQQVCKDQFNSVHVLQLTDKLHQD